MNNELYDMIFRRKSFNLFRNIGKEENHEKEKNLTATYEIF